MTARHLVRTCRGTMIHRNDCRYARKGTPWRWADRVPKADLIRAVDTFGYTLCAWCHPLGVIRTPRRGGRSHDPINADVWPPVSTMVAYANASAPVGDDPGTPGHRTVAGADTQTVNRFAACPNVRSVIRLLAGADEDAAAQAMERIATILGLPGWQGSKLFGQYMIGQGIGEQ